MLANEKDNDAVARALGLQGVFNLNYSNHWMDGVSKPELRLRLIFLIRLLKADTVVGYDPWGHYEENPDHVVTAQCVEAACWMAGGGKDYPEHFAAGLEPHAVGRQHGLEYAEGFHYVGPNALGIGYSREETEEYVRRNAVPAGSD